MYATAIVVSLFVVFYTNEVSYAWNCFCCCCCCCCLYYFNWPFPCSIMYEYTSIVFTITQQFIQLLTYNHMQTYTNIFIGKVRKSFKMKFEINGVRSWICFFFSKFLRILSWDHVLVKFCIWKSKFLYFCSRIERWLQLLKMLWP